MGWEGFHNVWPGPLSWMQSATCFIGNTFCPTPPALFEQPGGQIFFWMLAFSNIFVVLMFVSVTGGFINRLRDPAAAFARSFRNPTTKGLAAMQSEGLGKTPVTVLLPCYLPNEQHILNDTIEHIIHKLQYGYAFTLVVCYNTPEPLAYEAELQLLHGKAFPNGRKISILKVDGSTSKAENLNLALESVDTEHVVIYDADHHPDPESLLVATAHLASTSVSCVQGSTYLRTFPNYLAYYINAEFFVTHFVFFPAMQFLTGMGVFGGSNALWRTSDLRAYQFRHDVQTEDIELSTRAILGGEVKISFCPECRSGELPPATFLALYRQRLRWALGWDQVTLQHARSIWSANLNCGEKLGLYYILPARWGLLFSATLNALIAPVVASTYLEKMPGAELGAPIETCQALSFGCFLAVCTVTALNTITHEPPSRWVAVFFFQFTGVLYIGWQLLLVIVSLSKICRGVDGGWVVTKRSDAQPMALGEPPSPAGTPLGAAFASTGGSGHDGDAMKLLPMSFLAPAAAPGKKALM